MAPRDTAKLTPRRTATLSGEVWTSTNSIAGGSTMSREDDSVHAGMPKRNAGDPKAARRRNVESG
jgi:hypothetical protein